MKAPLAAAALVLAQQAFAQASLPPETAIWPKAATFKCTALEMWLQVAGERVRQKKALGPFTPDRVAPNQVEFTKDCVPLGLKMPDSRESIEYNRAVIERIREDHMKAYPKESAIGARTCAEWYGNWSGFPPAERERMVRERGRIGPIDARCGKFGLELAGAHENNMKALERLREHLAALERESIRQQDLLSDVFER